MREYWEDRVRGQMMAAIGDSGMPQAVSSNLVDFGKAVDKFLSQVVDYSNVPEDKMNSKKATFYVHGLIKASLMFIKAALSYDSMLLWTPSSRAKGESLVREITRCMNSMVSPNWWPAAATIRYAAPVHNHAEVVGCAPYFLEELLYEGIEYTDDGRVIEPAPSYQLRLVLCGYLDHTGHGLADLVVTTFVGFSSTFDGECKGLESMVSSEKIAGMSPDAAWIKALQRMKSGNFRRAIDVARAELAVVSQVVH